MKIRKMKLAKKDRLEEAYKLVYVDLCKNHAHLMAAYNGTLHKDDVRPVQWEVGALISDIVRRGAS